MTYSSAEVQLARQIIESSSHPKHGYSVFCIGPYGNRISFASQQQRALSLVWALHVLSILTEHSTQMSSNASSQSTKHIGVVGGGLAGLTAAAAFITKGHRCTIFEKNKVILPNLNNGTRHIHPTINFWPLEPRAPATNFPFLNWHEGTPKNIEKQIQKDIDFLRTSPLLKIREQTKVTNFSVKQDANFRDADRISLFYQNNYDENNEKRKSKEVNVDCDILVISSGYSRSKSNWSNNP